MKRLYACTVITTILTLKAKDRFDKCAMQIDDILFTNIQFVEIIKYIWQGFVVGEKNICWYTIITISWQTDYYATNHCT
jgi:hypothetical protein